MPPQNSQQLLLPVFSTELQTPLIFNQGSYVIVHKLESDCLNIISLWNRSVEFEITESWLPYSKLRGYKFNGWLLFSCD